MAQWKEQQHRDSSDTAILTLQNKPDPEHRTWSFTVFSDVKFLVMNGLPQRGDSEMTDFKGEISGGLFLNTFEQLLFKLDPELDALARRLPDNAKYTSPDIQNEVIKVLIDLVKQKIAVACQNSGTKML